MHTFEVFQDEFTEQLNRENAKRLQVITHLLLIIVLFQIITYSLSDNELYSQALLKIKVVILMVGILIIMALQLLKKDVKIAVRYSSDIIFSSTFLMIFLSILNTFYAQGISNDISIYLLILTAVIAANRMNFRSTFIIISINYLFFAIGMAFFQKDATYLFSHRFNGAMSSVLALAISKMFYDYSVKDFMDKLDIDHKNRKLHELSQKDDLTGLYNRRTIYLHLAELIEIARKTKKRIYLGILDLDHFKEINDRYGHLYGDDVLRLIADKILENIRQEDFAGRYGGDEFVIVLYDIDERSVQDIMERILYGVKELEQGLCELSFSCGIAVWKGESSEELFERADTYMYDVKRRGRNRIQVESITI